MDIIGYDALRARAAEKRKKGELMGIGISSFTRSRSRPVAGLRHTRIKMFDSAEIRVHPTARRSRASAPRARARPTETTYAQIVAEELGFPAAHVQVGGGRHGPAPTVWGNVCQPLGPPTSGAAAALASRKIRDKAKKSRRTCSK